MVKHCEPEAQPACLFLFQRTPTRQIWVMTVVFDSHQQSTLDAVYVYEVPWSEFPIVPSYPHYPRQRGVKSSLPTALICTTSRRIPASASATQGPGKGGLVARLPFYVSEGRQPSEGGQIVLSNRVNVYHKSPYPSEEGTPIKHRAFFLKGKARIWPWLSYVCHICSTGSSQVRWLFSAHPAKCPWGVKAHMAGPNRLFRAF